MTTCSTYLASQLDLDNFVDITTIAETFSLDHLTQQAYHFMAKNLGKISGLYEFQRLNKRQLGKLLSLPYPVECPEFEVLQAVMCWLHYDAPQRVQATSELLARIQFSQIPMAQCESLLSSTECSDLSAHFPELQSILMNGMYEAKLRASGHVSRVSGLVNLRGFEEAVVHIGGFQSNTGMTNSLTFYHETSDEWLHLTDVPHVEQANFGVAVLNNDIYVVGGCFNQSLQENVHPFGFRYHVTSRTWSSIAAMIHERCGFFLASDGSRLYAIGSFSCAVGQFDFRAATSRKKRTKQELPLLTAKRIHGCVLVSSLSTRVMRNTHLHSAERFSEIFFSPLRRNGRPGRGPGATLRELLTGDEHVA